MQVHTTTQVLLKVTSILEEQKNSKTGIAATNDFFDHELQGTFNKVVSNFTDNLKRLYKGEKIVVASGKLNYIAYPILNGVWEETDGPRDMKTVPICKTVPVLKMLESTEVQLDFGEQVKSADEKSFESN